MRETVITCAWPRELQQLLGGQKGQAGFAKMCLWWAASLQLTDQFVCLNGCLKQMSMLFSFISNVACPKLQQGSKSTEPALSDLWQILENAAENPTFIYRLAGAVFQAQRGVITPHGDNKPVSLTAVVEGAERSDADQNPFQLRAVWTAGAVSVSLVLLYLDHWWVARPNNRVAPQPSLFWCSLQKEIEQ